MLLHTITREHHSAVFIFTVKVLTLKTLKTMTVDWRLITYLLIISNESTGQSDLTIQQFVYAIE